MKSMKAVALTMFGTLLATAQGQLTQDQATAIGGLQSQQLLMSLMMGGGLGGVGGGDFGSMFPMMLQQQSQLLMAGAAGDPAAIAQAGALGQQMQIMAFMDRRNHDDHHGGHYGGGYYGGGHYGGGYYGGHYGGRGRHGGGRHHDGGSILDDLFPLLLLGQNANPAMIQIFNANTPQVVGEGVGNGVDSLLPFLLLDHLRGDDEARNYGGSYGGGYGYGGPPGRGGGGNSFRRGYENTDNEMEILKDLMRTISDGASTTQLPAGPPVPAVPPLKYVGQVLPDAGNSGGRQRQYKWDGKA